MVFNATFNNISAISGRFNVMKPTAYFKKYHVILTSRMPMPKATKALRFKLVFLSYRPVFVSMLRLVAYAKCFEIYA